MKYMTQLEAAQAGLTIYIADKACKRGHGRERYTTTGQCVICTKERAKERQTRIREIRDEARMS